MCIGINTSFTSYQYNYHKNRESQTWRSIINYILISWIEFKFAKVITIGLIFSLYAFYPINPTQITLIILNMLKIQVELKFIRFELALYVC